jgi:diacylglycerol kinase (ATP)
MLREPGTKTKAIIIGNPSSGRAGSKGYLERWAEMLRSGGMEVEVMNTEHPDHATELAALAGDQLVIAAGGDGTVNEVVNGLSRNATLGILPLGTANVLARELALPLKPEAACEKILTGERLRIDVGVATDAGGTERRFACMAGLGFDARVVQEVDPRLKRYLKMLAFPLAALAVYFRERLPAMEVSMDGETHEVQFAIIANGRLYGGDFKTSDAASLTNGELQVVLVEKVGVLLRADVLLGILARRPLARSMKSVTAKEIQASSPGEVPVQIDGEAWGSLPMSFRIEPRALEVIR